MCGIVAYLGKRKQCKEVVLEGLSRLEYRGYDSAGFVCIDSIDNYLAFSKSKGCLAKLKEKLQGTKSNGFIGMGHTRWATHGVASEENAHPHFDCCNKVAVVHNGIIENHTFIRNNLIKTGHNFSSNTDSETIVHLFESILSSQNNLRVAAIELVKQLKGAFAVVFLMEQYPDQLLVIRHRSPLAIGLGKDEIFVASDSLVFSDKTNKAIFLPDETFAIIKLDKIEMYDFSGNPKEITTQSIENSFKDSEKQGFEHYMLKEIYEQKQAIGRTVHFYRSIFEKSIWDQLGLDKEKIKSLESINLVGAGTSWNAAKISQFFFETICKIPVRVHLASEFNYMPLFFDKNSLYVLISQSGETADTLEALRYINSKKMPSLALTNVASSSLVRESGGYFLIKAGPEISVCSTKAFSCQLVSLYWLANFIALQKGLIDAEKMETAEEDLLITAELLESSIEKYKRDISGRLAKIYSKFDRFIFLGRNIFYPFAMEAALKLKEISYSFAQAYPAGELKHGPIALIDENVPVILFSSLDKRIYPKIVVNAQEVKARQGHLVIFAFEGQKELEDIANEVFIIPPVEPLLAPLVMTGLMQFFAYQITKELGRPIDKPRNLAKSVTVE